MSRKTEGLKENKAGKNCTRYIQLCVLGAVLAAMSIATWFFSPWSLLAIPFIATLVSGYTINRGIVRRSTEELSEASRIHLATVEALASAIDARDQVGSGHIRRTQIYAVGIGREMGLGPSDLKALETGALLHDIGKLAVPEHILNKAGRLTQPEFDRTKIHTSVGASILEQVGFRYPVVPTVRHHHEHWDGSGYPDGISGESIPLTARILAVADAYDTIRSSRPYRPAVTRERACAMIQSEAGKKFDPNIVQVLIQKLSALESDLAAAGVGYDAIEEERFVREIKLAHREVFGLYELAREFSSSRKVSDTFDLFADKIAEFVPFDGYVLYLLDKSKARAMAAHVKGRFAEELSSRKIRVGHGATGQALRAGESVFNVDPDLDFAHSESHLAGAFKTMAAIPLIGDGETIGAVTIYSSKLSEYGEEHMRLLETICRIAAEAISKNLRHDEAKEHALTDPMTGLPNARSLQMQFDKEAARAARGGTSFQLLMLDLDGFKPVNDRFGHKVGDEMLKRVGRVIKQQLRDYDFLGRYGGDEFVAILPETDSREVADVCERIERSVADFRLQVGDRFASVGVSLGTSGYPMNGETFDQMIIAADKAMYHNKITKKNLNPILIPATSVFVPESSAAPPPSTAGDALVVELDETHVVASTAVN
jgi:diguanylate cyclase (GGDEF)-like protein/putative nucleotidyltransferase with HDIG domain